MPAALPSKSAEPQQEGAASLLAAAEDGRGAAGSSELGSSQHTQDLQARASSACVHFNCAGVSGSDANLLSCVPFRLTQRREQPAPVGWPPIRCPCQTCRLIGQLTQNAPCPGRLREQHILYTSDLAQNLVSGLRLAGAYSWFSDPGAGRLCCLWPLLPSIAPLLTQFCPCMCLVDLGHVRVSGPADVLLGCLHDWGCCAPSTTNTIEVCAVQPISMGEPCTAETLNCPTLHHTH